ncbi:MAG: metallophosphoesterase [Casimicrobiaceae bacterium]
MKRVVQISDTHLSPGKSHFAGNWPPLRKWLLEQRPDVVIHTGDVTVDGADVEEDLAYCAPLFAELGVPVMCVPGNHDVGDAGHPQQPVDAARIARWRRHLGPDWWSIDIESWRLVGLDAMLFGSGLPLEHEQWTWLDATLRSAEGRSIAWFMHRPLFVETPDEGDTGYWSVKPAARAPLFAKLREHHVALVASGHLHQMHDRTHQGCRYVFGPSAGFIVSDARQKKMPGDKQLGAVVYEFENDLVDVHTVELDVLTRYWIDDVVHEVYPAPSAV